MIRKEPVIVGLVILTLFIAAVYELNPVSAMMDWKIRRDAGTAHGIDTKRYEIVDHSGNQEAFLTVDFLQGPHFWHPQIAIWLEDSSGHYLETLLVTSATAKGLFFSGRNPENYKLFDENPHKENYPTARVDALPYWSHKRGVQYNDGLYSPDRAHPIVDGTSSATPRGNFILKSSPSLVNYYSFKIMIEINVAFDENEFYSEYDFLDDSLYHSGTGLLGQPSVIYSKTIRKTDRNNYYIMDLIGHGHHSAKTGELYAELNNLTTAKSIAERIVVGVNKAWYVYIGANPKGPSQFQADETLFE